MNVLRLALWRHKGPTGNNKGTYAAQLLASYEEATKSTGSTNNDTQRLTGSTIPQFPLLDTFEILSLNLHWPETFCKSRITRLKPDLPRGHPLATYSLVLIAAQTTTYSLHKGSPNSRVQDIKKMRLLVPLRRRRKGLFLTGDLAAGTRERNNKKRQL